MKVSIITASFNSARTIRDTLASVAAQTYPDIEHIIIDGASTDNTLEIVGSFLHVARVISEPDQGIYDAMNKGIALATGDIVGILNSDDFYADAGVIARIVEAMQSYPADAAYGDLVYVHPVRTDRIVRTWRSGPFHARKFLFGWMPPHPAFFVRRAVYTRWGGFNTTLRTAADYELMLRFLYRHRVPVIYIPGILVRMRSGGSSNASWRARLRANREDRMAWRLNGLRPYPFTTWLKPVRKIAQFIRNVNPAS